MNLNLIISAGFDNPRGRRNAKAPFGLKGEINLVIIPMEDVDILGSTTNSRLRSEITSLPGIDFEGKQALLGRARSYSVALFTTPSGRELELYRLIKYELQTFAPAVKDRLSAYRQGLVQQVGENELEDSNSWPCRYYDLTGPNVLCRSIVDEDYYKLEGVIIPASSITNFSRDYHQANVSVLQSVLYKLYAYKNLIRDIPEALSENRGGHQFIFQRDIKF